MQITQQIEQLAFSDSQILHLSGFYEPESCQKVIDQIYKMGFEDYSNYQKCKKSKYRIRKIGLPLITCIKDCKQGKQNYFGSVQESYKNQKELFEHAPSLIQKVTDLLEQIFPVSVLEEKNCGKYFAGVIKVFTETPVHEDEFHCYKEWEVATLSSVFVINCYLQVNQSGGELVVYNQILDPKKDSKHRNCGDGEYGYKDELVKDAQCTIIKPKQGDLIMFPTLYLHKAQKILDSSVDRINFNVFVGYKDKMFYLFS